MWAASGAKHLAVFTSETYVCAGRFFKLAGARLKPIVLYEKTPTTAYS
ncbi:hypothetical protein PC129_g12476 [Phytophthora cactorum]|uniref:Uncharacterized protein n=1 Tax=Phytophthora cactorum TaxID=29920 RepID=A0A329SIS1_9STRA|nr:hypothetical protein Pcac1_g19373 [Phytophthora cactorum]KAG2823285.1 hypothetical protein PC111_g10292 [Phytophthora cactorum]KAG2846956.1 hypothetical protein PC112_g1262 [Phytophthora cactorum]KAG2869533.1 hypothetical protein PC113_g101 [Phytophthora cactorum]KAG2926447.1 hypothetical protein PC117_g14886 [Phytophthora cactorum]